MDLKECLTYNNAVIPLKSIGGNSQFTALSSFISGIVGCSISQYLTQNQPNFTSASDTNGFLQNMNTFYNSIQNAFRIMKRLLSSDVLFYAVVYDLKILSLNGVNINQTIVQNLINKVLSNIMIGISAWNNYVVNLVAGLFQNTPPNVWSTAFSNYLSAGPFTLPYTVPSGQYPVYPLFLVANYNGQNIIVGVGFGNYYPIYNVAQVTGQNTIFSLIISGMLINLFNPIVTLTYQTFPNLSYTGTANTSTGQGNFGATFTISTTLVNANLPLPLPIEYAVGNTFLQYNEVFFIHSTNDVLNLLILGSPYGNNGSTLQYVNNLDYYFNTNKTPIVPFPQFPINFNGYIQNPGTPYQLIGSSARITDNYASLANIYAENVQAISTTPITFNGQTLIPYFFWLIPSELSYALQTYTNAYVNTSSNVINQNNIILYPGGIAVSYYGPELDQTYNWADDLIAVLSLPYYTNYLVDYISKSVNQSLKPVQITLAVPNSYPWLISRLSLEALSFVIQQWLSGNLTFPIIVTPAFQSFDILYVNGQMYTNVMLQLQTPYLVINGDTAISGGIMYVNNGFTILEPGTKIRTPTKTLYSSDIWTPDFETVNNAPVTLFAYLSPGYPNMIGYVLNINNPVTVSKFGNTYPGYVLGQNNAIQYEGQLQINTPNNVASSDVYYIPIISTITTNNGVVIDTSSILPGAVTIQNINLLELGIIAGIIIGGGAIEYYKKHKKKTQQQQVVTQSEQYR